MSPLPLVLALAAAALAAAAPARILAVRVEEMGARHAIRIVALGELGDVGVHREGPDLVLAMTAEAPAGLSPPAPVGPIEAIRIRREPPGVTVHVQVSPEVPFEVRREASLVTVLFGAGEEKPETPSSDLAELYKLIFPAPAIEGAEVPGQVAEPAGQKGSEDSGGGLGLGPFSFRPSVALSYVNAKTTLLSGTPRPVSDDYIEVQPRLGTELSLWDGRFTADYEPKIRGYSSNPQAQKPSHIVNARLELPIAERLTLGASEHWVRGFLEVNEVDPGGEYFFRLGRFTRNQVGASARVEIAPRIGLDLGADFNQVRFDGPSSFFPYDSHAARAGVYFEITPDLRSVLSYVYDRVPAPKERLEAESTAHGAQLALTGDLAVFTGAVSVGYRDQRSPRAAEGGQRFRGLTLGASVTKQFGRAASLEISASRATQLSAFEGNAFYVANTTQAELTLPLPLSFSLRGGAGYHWNEYKTAASGFGDRRKDRILGWSAGLGRAFSRWAYLRTDYRRDRRNSNLDVFDAETEAFTLQAGLGLLGGSRRR